MSLYTRNQGKKVDVDYDTGLHFTIEFHSEDELEWKTLKPLSEGNPDHEVEPYYAYDLGDDRYMLNWVENSGVVVSQIQDYGKGTVHAFLTWPDPDARGKRHHLIQKGTLKVVD